MDHAPRHAVFVRAEQRHDEHGPQRVVFGLIRFYAKRDGHLRHVFVPSAVAHKCHEHGVRCVLQERRVRVLGQQRRLQLLSVHRSRSAGLSAAAPTAAHPATALGRARTAITVVPVHTGRIRPPARLDETARPLFRRPVQTELVERVERPENRHVHLLVNARAPSV